MATLADCATADFRERMLRWLFLQTSPPWEDTTGGTPSSWPFTQFVCTLHKTAEPGETGDLTTNLADYTSYADIAYARGATHWSIINGGTSTPSVKPKQAWTWPKNTGASQDIYGVGFGLTHSGTDHGICRHALSPAVAIATNKRPNIGAFQSQIAFDVSLGGSATSEAAFDSWEEAEAKYLAYGALVGYTGGFPGLTSNGNAQPSIVCLLKSDPRSALTYPNVFRTVVLKNATYEPSATDYEGYAPVSVPRLEADANGWEAVETSAGVWKVRNKTALNFPAATGGTTGSTLTHAMICVPGSPNLFLSANYYSIRVAELDAAITIPNGGGAGPTINAQTLEFEIR